MSTPRATSNYSHALARDRYCHKLTYRFSRLAKSRFERVKTLVLTWSKMIMTRRPFLCAMIWLKTRPPTLSMLCCTAHGAERHAPQILPVNSFSALIQQEESDGSVCLVRLQAGLVPLDKVEGLALALGGVANTVTSP